MDKVIVLAAGASSRFWPLSSSSHKAFYRIGMGKTIIEETVAGLLDQAKEIDIVVGPRDLGQAEELFKDDKIKIFVLDEPTGAGNAILKAFEDNFSGNFFVTWAEKINAGKILELLLKEKEAIALRKTDNPENFGIVSLDQDGNITQVVEKPSRKEAPSEYKITGGYLLNSSFLPLLEKFSSDHYSLETGLNEYFRDNKVKGVFVEEVEDTRLKFPWDLLGINKKIQNEYSLSFIHDEAEISTTSVIEGPVYIGKGAKISDFVKIVGPVYIGENAYIGNFSLIRDNSFIDKDAVIGAHCEVKNSIVYAGASVHRAYVGDSIIDQGARIGAGVIFANRRNDRGEIRSSIKGEKVSTGFTSFGSIIGSGVKVGVNSSLMPGVKLGKNSTVWPGRVVLEDIPDNQTFK